MPLNKIPTAIGQFLNGSDGVVGRFLGFSK